MQKLLEYPNLHFQDSLITDGRIILMDEFLNEGVCTELQQLSTTDGYKLSFINSLQLAETMEGMLQQIVDKEPSVLLVFPGNGSNYPRMLSKICQEFPHQASVIAKRLWVPGTDPVVTVGRIIPELYLVMGVKTVVVIDDVISSGLTMQKLYQFNAWRFPPAKWFGVAWLAQIPQTKAKSGVKGYDSIAVSKIVGKTNGSRIPVNSLSTLRQDREIGESYAYRNFKNPELFLQLIRR